MSEQKTSIVFTGDIGFDRYMDKRWEDGKWQESKLDKVKDYLLRQL